MLLAQRLKRNLEGYFVKYSNKWIRETIELLDQKGIGPGSIVELATTETLLVCKKSADLDEPKKYFDLLYNDLGIEENPPHQFYVADIEIVFDYMILLKLIGGTCFQDCYYFSIEMLEPTARTITKSYSTDIIRSYASILVS